MQNNSEVNMQTKTINCFKNRAFLIELFLILNYAFLVIDIYFAHSINKFGHWSEWIPFYFSIVVAGVLSISVLKRGGNIENQFHRHAGILLGWVSIVVGIAGMILHLESQYFQQFTLKSLVYTAPFVAPLAYTGLGLLLLLNRMVNPQTKEWGNWIIFLALGGFVGNFILSVVDHAQNGFFSILEWTPVWSSAFAVGCLTAVLFTTPNKAFLKICVYIMLIQIVVGVVGFLIHLYANIEGLSDNVWDNFVYGTPLFAPCLLPNVALLGLIGLWNNFHHLEQQNRDA